MEEKVMTFQELINYASDARDEFTEKQKEKRRKKEEDIRIIIEKVIDNAKKYGAVRVTWHTGIIYLRNPNSKDDIKIKESKDITLEDLEKAINRIPALYAELDKEGNILFVTFRRSKTDSDQ